MSELFAVEKLEMENEYTTFATQYDELQVQINNDSLRERLESEKLKTQRLLEELRQVKTSNAAEIMRLKKELKTVRAVLRTYVIQIDSLNKLNQALAEENQEVKTEIYAGNPPNQQSVSGEKEPERKGDVSIATGCNRHHCTSQKQAGKNSQEGERCKEDSCFLHYRQKHHRQNRRTHLIYTHSQTGQRCVDQKCIQHIPIREPRTDLFYQEIYRVYRRGTKRDCLLGCGRIPSGRHLPCVYLCRRNHDRATGIQHEINSFIVL